MENSYLSFELKLDANNGTNSSSDDASNGPSHNDTRMFWMDVVISVPLLLCIVVVYSHLRRHAYWSRVFEARRGLLDKLMGHGDVGAEELSEERHRWQHFSISLPKLSNDRFYWLWQCCTMSTSEFAKCAGFDAMVFRIFIRGCIFIAVTTLPFILIVLIPVYASGRTDKSLLTVTSIMNLPKSSPRFWAPTVGLWVLVLVTLYYFTEVFKVVAYAADKFMVGNTGGGGDATQMGDARPTMYRKYSTPSVVESKLKMRKKPAMTRSKTLGVITLDGSALMRTTPTLTAIPSGKQLSVDGTPELVDEESSGELEAKSGVGVLDEIDEMLWFGFSDIMSKVVTFNLDLVNTVTEPGVTIASSLWPKKSMSDMEPEEHKGYTDSVVIHEDEEEEYDEQSSLIRGTGAESAGSMPSTLELESGTRPRKAHLLGLSSYGATSARRSAYNVAYDPCLVDRWVPINHYTVVVRDLPPVFMDERMLAKLMIYLFPGQLSRVWVTPNVAELVELASRIDFHKRKLWKLRAKHLAKMEKEKEEENARINGSGSLAETESDDESWDADISTDDLQIEVLRRSHCCGLFGAKVDLIEFHTRELRLLKRRFVSLRRSDSLTPCPTAFVQFKSLTATTICASVPVRIGMKTLKIKRAAAARDIRWDTLQYRSEDLVPRHVIVAVAFALLNIFWAIPVAATQAIANVHSLCEAFGGSHDCEENMPPKVRAFVEGFLSVVILGVALLIVPLICRKLTLYSGKSTYGSVEMHTMLKEFDSLCCMVLLVTVIAGVANDNINRFTNRLVSNLSHFVTYLAAALARMSAYFLLYVVISSLIWIPGELLRIGYFFDLLFDPTDRFRFPYSTKYSRIMLTFTIAITFSLMCPFIMPFALLYFVFCYVVYTYQLTTCFIPEYQTGAQIFPFVFGRIVVGLYIAITTIMGLMVLERAYECATMCLPLYFVVHLVYARNERKYTPMFKSASLTSAIEKDHQIMQWLERQGLGQFQATQSAVSLERGVYIPPVMKLRYGE